MSRQRVLFLCTGNSCRSQMAEGFLRHLYPDRFEALSAGTNPAGYVHSRAVDVMRAIGVDISAGTSKDIDGFLPPNGLPPHLIVGVCSSANENCPVFPADVEHLHWPFDDPAHATGSNEEIMAEFVRVRDEIREKIESFFRDKLVSVLDPAAE
jgi:arsenate reductase